MARAKYYNTVTEQWEYFDFAPQGATGPAGPDGATGATGPAGAGVTIIGGLANSGDLPGSGTLGDAYLITGDLWVWNGSSWENTGGVQGPTGPQGPVGATGATGHTGPAGSSNEWLNGSGVPAGGTGNLGDYYINNNTNQYYQKTGASTWTLRGTLGDAGKSVIAISQNSHGFSVGDVLKSSGTDGEYTKAQADSEANAEVLGIVTEVIDTDTFNLTTSGLIDVASAVPNELAGTVLYLSESSAGALTATEPNEAGEVSKPVAVITTANSEMLMLNMRGVVLDEQDSTTIDADTLGGDTKAEVIDQAELKVKIGVIPGAIIGSTGNQSITGVGFRPKLVKFFGLYDIGSITRVANGAMDENGNQYAINAQTDGAPYSSRYRTDSCYMARDSGDAGDILEAEYVSMDSDGFTINVITANDAYDVAYEAYG